MTGLEVLQSVQFVTVKGRRLVVLSAEDWDALIEWLENLEDTRIVKRALGELKAANGEREKAKWLEWGDAAERLPTLEALLKETQLLPQARALSEDEIAAEVAAYRSGQC